METKDWISLGTAIIALTAIIISIITLWKTHLAKFNPLITIGTCRLRIYPIKNGNERWYLPSFDIPLSFTNQGAQTGRIEDIRIKITYPKLPISNHFEMFYPKWDVNGKEISNQRFEWIEKSVKEDWMSFVLLSRETKNKHLIFETRWEEPVIQGIVNCALEVKYTGTKAKWKEIGKWTTHLTKDTWYDMAENGRSYGTSPNIEENIKELIYPLDLHKYTGTKDSIEPDQKDTPPSYLDYKKKK
jgi:hypothetical protein